MRAGYAERSMARVDGKDKYMKYAFKAALMLLLFAGSPYVAFSCSCADPSVREKFRQANAVFVGKIVEVKPSAETKADFRYFPQVVTFTVKQQWKGARKPEIVVLVSTDWQGMCGDLDLIVGESYLIYAHRKNGRLIVHRDCGPSMPLRYAAQDMG